MFKKKIKIRDLVVEKVTVAAQILGCSEDEFVEKVLLAEVEKVLNSTGSKQPDAKQVEDIANKLKGLGYLE